MIGCFKSYMTLSMDVNFYRFLHGHEHECTDVEAFVKAGIKFILLQLVS